MNRRTAEIALLTLLALAMLASPWALHPTTHAQTSTRTALQLNTTVATATAATGVDVSAYGPGFTINLDVLSVTGTATVCIQDTVASFSPAQDIWCTQVGPGGPSSYSIKSSSLPDTAATVIGQSGGKLRANVERLSAGGSLTYQAFILHN
jgi:hypothetical protein